MIYKDETEFAQRLKLYEPLRVYFLYGEQNYLKKLYCKKIAEKAVGAAADFNVQRLDGTQAGVDEISDAVEALPMMGGRKCVTVRDLDAAKLSATDEAKLEELLADPPESAVLVFYTLDVVPDTRKAKWKAFLKRVDAVGAVLELGTRAPSDMSRFLQTLAERSGCRMTADVCTFLRERCGDDMQALQNEVAKLCAYRSEGEITRADVALCCAAQLDVSVFDLAKLILKNDYQGAMRSLGELLDMREEPVAILGALSGGFIDLYRARAARENGRTGEELCALYKSYKGREWRIRNAMRDSGRFTRAQLADALDLLARADYRLKSSRTDNAVILQETLTRLFAALQSAPARG